MSWAKELWWDEYPCSACGEAPSLLDRELCEACSEVLHNATPNQ